MWCNCIKCEMYGPYVHVHNRLYVVRVSVYVSVVCVVVFVRDLPQWWFNYIYFDFVFLFLNLWNFCWSLNISTFCFAHPNIYCWPARTNAHSEYFSIIFDHQNLFPSLSLHHICHTVKVGLQWISYPNNNNVSLNYSSKLNNRTKSNRMPMLMASGSIDIACGLSIYSTVEAILISEMKTIWKHAAEHLFDA